MKNSQALFLGGMIMLSAINVHVNDEGVRFLFTVGSFFVFFGLLLMIVGIFQKTK